jgi:hypothetical protein
VWKGISGLWLYSIVTGEARAGGALNQTFFYLYIGLEETKRKIHTIVFVKVVFETEPKHFNLSNAFE